MAKTNSNIPTLTQVVSEGDDSMLNHFNAQHLKNSTTDNAAAPVTVENATDIENIELKDMPSITPAHIRTTKLPKQDVSDSMQASIPTAGTATIDKEEIKEKIDHAINEVLPEIESKLRKNLYNKFGI